MSMNNSVIKGGTHSMDTVRVGVVGAGFMGTTHIQTLRRLSGVEVVALADASRDQAQKAAARLSVPQVYDDYEQLIYRSDVDVIHNCTPNHMHYAVSKLALENGKHVFSEKPLAADVKQGEELLQIAEDKQLLHGVNFVYRYYPIIGHAKKLIASGEIGAVRLLRGGYFQDWLAKETDFNWRVKSELGGPARALADIGSHFSDLIQYVMGDRIVSVFADLHTVIPIRKRSACLGLTFSHESTTDDGFLYEEVDTEDYAAVLLRTENGARGVFIVSQVSFGHKNLISLEVSGDKGSLAWNSQQHERLWIGRRDKPNQEILKDPAYIDPGLDHGFVHMPGGHCEGWLDNFTNLLFDFYRHLTGTNETSEGVEYPTFRDGLREMYIVEAMLSSHKQQKWMSVRSEDLVLGPER